MTDYDIIRIADAICDKLCNDERFMTHLAKVMPKRERLVSATQAAKILGCSVYTVRRNAAKLGGVTDSSGRWKFPERGLTDKYMTI
jgi:hypothetical protein